MKEVLVLGNDDAAGVNSACPDGSVGCLGKSDFAVENMLSVGALGGHPSSECRRKLCVDEEPHAASKIT